MSNFIGIKTNTKCPISPVRGMNKKNHIGQMWWIKYVVEISGIEPLTF